MNNRTNVAVSVVIPAYNCARTIAATMRSLREQTLDSSQIEIILINDGSTDSTLIICERLAREADNIAVIDKPNGGVGSARNVGIEAARGRYIAFLDSDDTLLPETLEAAVRFFDEHYDEIDLVTYPMRLYNEKREWPHVREQVLTETGVYDLTKLQNAFALITNVNVVVKNDEFLPRFREDLLIHEDELFFTTVLLRKLKVGFSKCGAYRYQQLEGSAIATKMHPFYQFEKNIGFWEDLFSAYLKKAPLYLQASFLNEVNWKVRKDVFFPYHYDQEDFQHALDRIRSLMDHVDNDVIFTSPRSDEYYRHYLASLRSHAALHCVISEGRFALLDSDGQLLLCRNHIDAEIMRTRVLDGELQVVGILRSVLFDHVDKPTLTLLLNGSPEQSIVLEHTSHNYHVGHTKTNRFWKFRASVPLRSNATASFSLSVAGDNIPLKLTFSSRANFDTQNGIFSFCSDEWLFEASAANGTISVAKNPSPIVKISHWVTNARSAARTNRKTLAVRIPLSVRRARRKPLWLYYDDSKIDGGDARLQFQHDIEIDDDVVRFFVSKSDEAELSRLFTSDQRKSIVGFASAEHRFLHLEADKIITSRIEHSSWCPFARKTMRGLADLIHYELVYLPHGVPHAHTPWERSADRTLVDREVVSTGFELRDLIETYGFKRSQLIPSGAPRFDLIDTGVAPQRKILYAPSWRKSLVNELPGSIFNARPGVFQTSSFWKGTMELLTSEPLLRVLEEHDYQLDVKLHPAFGAYHDAFASLESERVQVIDNVEESDYAILVTDWSSQVYDFVYLQRAIAYFVPDMLEFRAGLNSYRELDLPLENGFGPVSHNAEELVRALEHIMEQGGMPDSAFAACMEGFFLHYDNNQRDRLYKALIDSGSDQIRDAAEREA